MSIEELKNEIKALSGDERHELSSFLSKLELEDDADYWTRVRRRAGDSNPESWVGIDQLANG